MNKLFYIPIILGALFSCGNSETNEESVKKTHGKIVNKVDTMLLKRTNFKAQLLSNGKLRATQKSDLNFKGVGYVESLSVTNGDYVKKGSLIASLDNKEALHLLKQAEESFEKVKIDLQDVLLGFGYTIKDSLNIPKETMRIARVRTGYNSAITILEKAQMELENREIRAPFSGRIANLKTKLHENPRGEFFCTLINDSSFDVEFMIIEGEISKVKDGMVTLVSPFASPQDRYTGYIKHINPTVDTRGQMLVTATIKNERKDLIDGMNVKVFVESNIADQLVVPKSAVLIRDNKEVLFTVSDDGKAMWTYVYIKATNSSHYAVTKNTERSSELNENDIVIINGNINLADGTDVELKK